MAIRSTPPSPPLRIAVIGVGQIGSAFAFNLSKVGGHDVTVIARPGSPRLAQLQSDGAIVDCNGERAPVRILDAVDEETPYDLVIVTMLAHQVDTIMPALRRSAARCIQFMFNTFEPERLIQALGARCALGMPFIQAKLDPAGRLHAHIGGTGQKSLMGRQRLVDLFDASGLPAALEPDMASWLRSHAPLCVAFESVSVAAMRRGGGASWSEAHTLAAGVQACFTLIEARGHLIYPQSKGLIRRSRTGIAAMLWSMSRVRSFRDLLATGGTEARALVEQIVGAAKSRPDLVPAIAAMKPVV